ncbi:MAG: Xaa-Pro peptidase family protein [Bacteroidota bacterium]
MIRTRLNAVRRFMQILRLDAFIVTDLSHVFYLTGFTGSSGLCVITPQKQFFVTDNRYKAQAPLEVHGFQIVIAPLNLFQTIADKRILPLRKRIGFESQVLHVSEFRSLKKLFPSCRFIPTADIIETISAVKDASEIALLRAAVDITDKTFQKILPLIQPGVRESDIAAEISYWHKRYGADADAFDPIVAGGPRGALPHAHASERKIKHGEMLVMDFGCRCKGYHSDMTRTVAVGKPSATMRSVYAVVLEAQQKALDMLKAGAAARTIDMAARDVIQHNGFGKFFIHSLGHGLGLHVHEPLRLSAISKDVLQKGNIVTVEPGIYLPGIGGVRIEDDVVIDRDYGEVLNKSSKELIIL